MADTEKTSEAAYSSTGSAKANDMRYSLREMMEDVKTERQRSIFGRELVDSTEINKMFGKRIRKKKRK